MFEKFNQKIQRPVNFARRHKTKLACTATAVVTATVVSRLQINALEEAYGFIASKDLMDEFIDGTPATTE